MKAQLLTHNSKFQLLIYLLPLSPNFDILLKL
jgi:hypothetical protein